MLGALEERFFRSFLRQIGREELLDGIELKQETLGVLRPELEKIFASKDRDEWKDLFMNADVCLAPVNSISEAFADPQLRARGMVVSMRHPELGEIAMIGSPFRFSETACSYRLLPPTHGEHTESILAELGYSASEIDDLRQKKAV